MLDDIMGGEMFGGDDFLSLVGEHWSSDEIFSPWRQDADVSTGDVDAASWQQQTTPFTCAVVCQEMILREFGVDVSEAQLVYDATSNGWLTDQGTSPADMGNLLEHYGVPVHHGYGSGVESIAGEIAMGHKVIVALDGGEIWKQDSSLEDWLNPRGADHAVVVTGLDLSDPSHPKVVLNDPADPTGAGKAYPLDDFLDAWRDSGYLYVATDHAPPGLAEHSQFGAHFDPETGMYMDADFWAQWLQEAVSEFDAEFFKSLLERVAVAATIAAVSGVLGVPPVWDALDDAARNELFLNVV